MSEHGHCPKCGVDLDGGSIWGTFYQQALDGKHYRQEGSASPEEAERLADESAILYGASRARGQWGRAIGISCMQQDRIVKWECPDCAHEWTR
jgi:predicted RNA-binding Zn-ribbon protein involved in translation (DUF1610 family)